jgi:hypothetical protein
MSFVCLYEGRGECVECGGWAGQDPIDGRFCSTGCADSYAANQTEIERRQTERRADEDAYGEAVARLLAEGLDYEEIDRVLAGWP